MLLLELQPCSCVKLYSYSDAHDLMPKKINYIYSTTYIQHHLYKYHEEILIIAVQSTGDLFLKEKIRKHPGLDFQEQAVVWVGSLLLIQRTLFSDYVGCLPANSFSPRHLEPRVEKATRTIRISELLEQTGHFSRLQFNRSHLTMWIKNHQISVHFGRAPRTTCSDAWERRGMFRLNFKRAPQCCFVEHAKVFS